MSEWDGIEGKDAWTAKLSELLKESEQAARQGDFAARLTLSRRLTEFIVESRPDTDADIRALDAVARQAGESLLLVSIEERLAAIAGRSAELATLTKDFRARADKLDDAARVLRLERAQAAVQSLTDSVQALLLLRKALEDGSDGELAKNIDSVVGSIQKVRSAVERQA